MESTRESAGPAIRRIITCGAVLIAIHLQNILRPIRIMLQRRQAFHEPTAALVDG